MDIEDKDRNINSFSDYLASAKESLGALTWTWRKLQTTEQSSWMTRMLIYMFVNLISQGVSPFMISYVVNGLAEKSLEVIYIGIAGTTLFLAIQKWAHLKQASYRELIVGAIQKSVDNHITRMLFEKSLGQHAFHSSTLNIGNIDKGRWKLLDLQGILLFEGFQVLTTLVIAFVLLMVMSTVSGVILSLALSVYVSWSLFLNHRVVVECVSIDRRLRALNRRRVERWEKIERVKTSGKVEQELNEMSDEFDAILVDDRRFWLGFIRQNGFRDSAMLLGYLSIICYGAWKTYHDQMVIGDLFPIYAWSSTIVGNVWQIGRIEHIINWNMPAIKATIEAVSIPAEAGDSEDAVDVPDDQPISLEFKDVSYIYPEKSLPDDELEEETPHALRGVTFDVRSGEAVAIIGQSGAGKSTLARLLLRSMDPTSGSISVSGVDLRKLKYNSWMKTLGYIPQQSQVFDGTLKYNLLYGLTPEEAKKTSDESIWEMMRELQIDFGKRLTSGIYTEVGRNGIKLSGGQSQRLIIGAAAIKRPRMMLIDEATSSLDSTTERKVQLGLSKLLSGDVTAVIIAHRLSTVRHLCSKFVVLRSIDDLRCGESQVEAIAGSFEELYKISPTFRMLADDQEIRIL